MRATSLNFSMALRTTFLVVALIVSVPSIGSQHEKCETLTQMYQWVRLFDGLFALPREIVLIGSETGSHYFEERNFPGKPITAAGAAAVGNESQYQKDWVAREKGTSRLLSSTKRGSLVVEVFLEPYRDVLHYVHVTDGFSYAVLIGPVGERWGELLDATDEMNSCARSLR